MRRAYSPLELDPDVPVRQPKDKTVIWYVCAEMGVPSQQIPFVLSTYGSLIPCIQNARESEIDSCRLLRQENSGETFIVAKTSTGAYGLD